MKSLPSAPPGSNVLFDQEAEVVLAPRGRDVRDLALLAAAKRAVQGDKAVARRLLGQYSEAVATGQPVPVPLLRYVAEAFSRFLAGEVPTVDAALGVRRVRRGRPPAGVLQREVEAVATAWEYDTLRDEGHDRTSALGQIPCSERTVDRRRQRAKHGS